MSGSRPETSSNSLTHRAMRRLLISSIAALLLPPEQRNSAFYPASQGRLLLGLRGGRRYGRPPTRISRIFAPSRADSARGQLPCVCAPFAYPVQRPDRL